MSPSTSVRMFADDTRAARAIHALADALKLQDDLNSMYAWNKRSNMLENEGKFENMQYGYNHELKSNYDYMTPDFNSVIVKKSAVKDLGIWMSDNCEFSLQILKVIAKVCKTFGWVKRSFVGREANFLKFLWSTYCLPHINYSSQLWMPMGTPLMKSIEHLQESFTRQVNMVNQEINSSDY
jgi:hypothetical protein